MIHGARIRFGTSPKECANALSTGRLPFVASHARFPGRRSAGYVPPCTSPPLYLLFSLHDIAGCQRRHTRDLGGILQHRLLPRVLRGFGYEHCRLDRSFVGVCDGGASMSSLAKVVVFTAPFLFCGIDRPEYREFYGPEILCPRGLLGVEFGYVRR